MEGIEVAQGPGAGDTTVTIALHPLTANEEDRKYVSMTLRLVVGQEYPAKAPKVEVRVRVIFSTLGILEGLTEARCHWEGLSNFPHAIGFPRPSLTPQRLARELQHSLIMPLVL